MFRIARLTDYGLVLMTHMAARPERSLFAARDLAAETRLPVPTVSKVLKLLAAGGLLVSHRGAGGGYSLARNPDAISLAEMIRALEGPIALTMCAEGPGACELEAWCPDRSNWQRINEVILGALGGISLDEMTRPLPRHRFVTVGGGAAGGGA